MLEPYSVLVPHNIDPRLVLRPPNTSTPLLHSWSLPEAPSLPLTTQRAGRGKLLSSSRLLAVLSLKAFWVSFPLRVFLDPWASKPHPSLRRTWFSLEETPPQQFPHRNILMVHIHIQWSIIEVERRMKPWNLQLSWPDIEEMILSEVTPYLTSFEGHVKIVTDAC